MKILVVGAGATGGYFGGRLLQARRDVTFLVRPRRAAELAAAGLRLRTPQGDIAIPLPPTVIAEDLSETFDLILLSCKAFDLSSAIAAFAPAVGPDTVILPILNGLRHLDVLSARFGASVLGGRCLISAALDEHRDIVQFSAMHTLGFGERDGTPSPRVQAIDRQLSGAGFDAQLSSHIMLDMWEKWVFLATLAGGTCLMRAAVGDIIAAPGGTAFILGLLEECRMIAAAAGFAPQAPALDRARDLLTASSSPLTASMLRDLESGSRIEADHIVGDLLQRGARAGLPPQQLPLLAVVYAALKSHENRAARLPR